MSEKNEALLIRDGHHFRCATQADRDSIARIKPGMSVKVNFVSQSSRSLQHHKLYWGGLLALVMDYWVPDAQLITPAERQTLRSFCKFLDSKGGDKGAIKRAGKVFLDELSAHRVSIQIAPEASIQSLHEWIKEQVGYTEWKMTPEGPVKRTRSINFNAMSQEQFNEYYKRAFSVCWKFVLSQEFESEAAAQNIIDQLAGMG